MEDSDKTKFLGTNSDQSKLQPQIDQQAQTSQMKLNQERESIRKAVNDDSTIDSSMVAGGAEAVKSPDSPPQSIPREKSKVLRWLIIGLSIILLGLISYLVYEYVQRGDEGTYTIAAGTTGGGQNEDRNSTGQQTTQTDDEASEVGGKTGQQQAQPTVRPQVETAQTSTNGDASEEGISQTTKGAAAVPEPPENSNSFTGASMDLPQVHAEVGVPFSLRTRDDEVTDQLQWVITGPDDNEEILTLGQEVVYYFDQPGNYRVSLRSMNGNIEDQWIPVSITANSVNQYLDELKLATINNDGRGIVTSERKLEALFRQPDRVNIKRVAPNDRTIEVFQGVTGFVDWFIVEVAQLGNENPGQAVSVTLHANGYLRYMEIK